MRTITLTLTEETAGQLLRIDERYYFGLFEPIRTNEEEEYRFRDAVAETAEQIRQSLTDTNNTKEDTMKKQIRSIEELKSEAKEELQKRGITYGRLAVVVNGEVIEGESTEENAELVIREENGRRECGLFIPL
jgi:uncharacterized protein YktB (UPF0637 family)